MRRVRRKARGSHAPNRDRPDEARASDEAPTASAAVNFARAFIPAS
jgi:hypothetical protein